MKLISMVAAAALMAAGAGAANAAVTTYTSSAAFNAAISGFTTTVEDFSSGTAGQTIASGGSFNGVTYTTSGPTLNGTIITNQFNSFSGLSLGGNQSGGAQFFFDGDSVTATFAAPVFAVGAFFNVNANSGNFGVTVGGDTSSSGSGTYDTSTFVFAGLVSDTSFTSATFFSNSDCGCSASFNIPEIISATTAVPEPATWAMMLVGFGGLGAMLRRRRELTSLAAA